MFCFKFRHLFYIWVICNIEWDFVLSELYTQSKYITNAWNNVPQSHDAKYKFPLEAQESASNVNASKDILNGLSWKCANNSSCFHNFLNDLFESYRHGDTIKLGILEIIKLPQVQGKSFKSHTGRSMTTLMDFLNGYALRVPIGPMVFSVERSSADADYIEVAILKKSPKNSQARFSGMAEGDDYGRHRREKHDEKKVQMFIPFYLAATTFGWTMLAFKAVSVMVLKTLALSKIAFIVAAMVFVKKMMEETSQKLLHHYNEPPPYMMPYNMNYGMHPAMPPAPMDMGSVSGDDMYPGSMPYHPAAGAIASPLVGGSVLSNPSLEHFSAESHIHQMESPNIESNSQMLLGSYNDDLRQMVKRTGGSTYLGRQPSKFLPFRIPLSDNFVNNNLYRRIITATSVDATIQSDDEEN